MSGLHACKTLVGIIEDVEESLDDVRDDLHVVQAKTEGAVEATTLGIKTKSGLRPNSRKTRGFIYM